MNTPTKIKGIYHLIGHKRAAATAAAIEADKMDSPRKAHDLNLSAEMLEEEAAGYLAHANSDCEAIDGIEHLIHYLMKSPIKSTGRTLAQHALEEASMRLRRELGEAEPLRNFEIVPEETKH